MRAKRTCCCQSEQCRYRLSRSLELGDIATTRKISRVFYRIDKNKRLTFTIVPLRFLSTFTSVTVEVPISVRQKFPDPLLKLDQHVAFWPVIGTTLEVALKLFAAEFPPKLKMSNPTPASVARMAFVPGMTVMENGSRPPARGVDLTGSAESEPSAAISHAARNPEHW